MEIARLLALGDSQKAAIGVLSKEYYDVLTTALQPEAWMDRFTRAILAISPY